MGMSGDIPFVIKKGMRIIPTPSFIAPPVIDELLPVSPSPVANMHESRIDYQLVKGQSQINYKSCQTLNDAEIALAVTPERAYIRRFAQNVLG